MNLIEARAKLAATLAPIDSGDPTVLTSLVDAIQPPALMIGWGEPWLEPDTACFARGRVVVTAVASRLMPGEGVAQLESLVRFVLDRVQADTTKWALESVTGPRVFTIASTTYLATRITLRIAITT